MIKILSLFEPASTKGVYESMTNIQQNCSFKPVMPLESWKSIFLYTMSFILLTACNPQDDPERISDTPQSDNLISNQVMRLTGDVGEAYTNGRFVVFNPKPAKSGQQSTSVATTKTSQAASMNASTEAKTDSDTPPKTQSETLEDSLNVVGATDIQEDGSFSLEIPVEEPMQVYFYVLGAVSEDGNMLAPLKGQQFILESGDLNLKMNSKRRFIVHGGYFNDAVFNKWKNSQMYLDAYQEYDNLLKEVVDESEQQRRDRVDAYSAKYSEILDLEVEGRREISITHPDPEVRKLTIQTTWLGGPWIREALHRLAQMTPDDEWVRERVARADAAWEKRQEQNKIDIGSPILDFQAETIEGDLVSLNDILRDTQIVLLEFWASWCGPCRAEIPHMKEAYSRFKEKGFEIVSFTIDESKEDWEIATVEEDIPWVNLGMGPSADAPTKYYVTGVPHNYLVDSASGKIIGRNLRGHHLDEMLEQELL